LVAQRRLQFIKLWFTPEYDNSSEASLPFILEKIVSEKKSQRATSSWCWIMDWDFQLPSAC